MTFYVEMECEQNFPFDVEETVKNVVTGALTCMACPYEAEVNFLLTDASGIREINKAYRGMDKETDVLSFPALDYDAPLDFSYVEANPMAYCNPETEELILGDIMLNADQVVSQAAEFGHSELREFAFLIVHSVLHLLGFDHMQEDEEKEMLDKQKRIMEYLDIPR